ncbi:PepSY domain-containing protein [Aliiglaciecola litoralis]|uniref:PepSY domain-containing protein n=1 Tax=Aliiglaciecola litoralis TaxID=582857 RepID=A0ABN1LDB5_9ALTE
MIKQSFRGLTILMLTFALLSGQASAQDTRPTISPAQAAQNAQKQVNGRVLRVDQSKNTYRVKVLQKTGRVVTVDVDKRSGRVTKQRSKDK